MRAIEAVRKNEFSAMASGSDSACGRFLTVAAAIIVILVLRKPDALWHPQFWAEDGVAYYTQALLYGPPAIARPLAGCWWLLPRLVASAAILLPVRRAPLAFNLVALVGSALCCALFSLPAYRHLVKSDRLRTICCFLFATAVFTEGELIGTLTNLPWYLSLAAVGSLALSAGAVARMRARTAAAIAGGGMLCALSSPVIAALLPIALWRAWAAIRERNWNLFAIAAATIAGIAIQESVDLSHLAHPHGKPPWLPNLPLALAYLVVWRTMAGSFAAKILAGRFLWPAAAAAWSLIGAVLISMRRRLPISVALGALLLMVAPIGMSIVGRQLVWATGTQVVIWSAERYFLLPACATIFLAAAAIDRLTASSHAAVLAMATLFGLGVFFNFRVPAFADFDWPSEAQSVREWQLHGCPVTEPVPPGVPFEIRLPDRSHGSGACMAQRMLDTRAIEEALAGPPVAVASWKADAAWTIGGYHPSVGTLAGQVLYGSYSGSDANVGKLISAPFETGTPGCVVLPIAHGPSIAGQSLKLAAGETGAEIGMVPLDPARGEWGYWEVKFDPRVPRIRIIAEDRGSRFGEWLAVGEPHQCR